MDFVEVFAQFCCKRNCFFKFFMPVVSAAVGPWVAQHASVETIIHRASRDAVNAAVVAVVALLDGDVFHWQLSHSSPSWQAGVPRGSFQSSSMSGMDA